MSIVKIIFSRNSFIDYFRNKYMYYFRNFWRNSFRDSIKVSSSKFSPGLFRLILVGIPQGISQGIPSVIPPEISQKYRSGSHFFTVSCRITPRNSIRTISRDFCRRPFTDSFSDSYMNFSMEIFFLQRFFQVFGWVGMVGWWIDTIKNCSRDSLRHFFQNSSTSYFSSSSSRDFSKVSLGIHTKTAS